MSRRQYFILLALSVPLVTVFELPQAMRWLVRLPEAITSKSTRPSLSHEIDRAAILTEAPLPFVQGNRRSDSFPDIELTDQNGQRHHFRTDLVSGHIVCIALFYTQCTGTCPGTIQTMKDLRDALKTEFPPNAIRFIAITLDPENDGPDELLEYAKARSITNNDDMSEWLFCTGTFDDVEKLRRGLGLFELDPELDSDRTQHASVLTIGNDQTDRWVALPSGLQFNDILETFLRITGTTERQRFSTRISRSDEFMKTSTTTNAAWACCSDVLAFDNTSCCLNPSESCSLPDAISRDEDTQKQTSTRTLPCIESTER